MGNRWHPSECRVCGARAPFASISARGFCRDHGQMRREANITELVSHSGPWFSHWRRRSLAALGVVVPLDDTDGDG